MRAAARPPPPPRTHTTLGFSSAMSKWVVVIERDMKLENILVHFMVNIEAESNHDCFATQTVDMLTFVLNFLKKNDVENVLLSYKDHRFGCLSRAAAVLLYNYDWLSLYLNENPDTANRLACLIRNVFELPYLKVVFVAFAGLGIHLIEPFYCRTI